MKIIYKNYLQSTRTTQVHPTYSELERSYHRHASRSDAGQRVGDPVGVGHLEEKQGLAGHQLSVGHLHVREMRSTREVEGIVEGIVE